MGAANVIPGVSGGTVAFITGIFETLINALKSFDGTAIKLLLGFKLKEFWEHINGRFLVPLGLGVVFSFATLAKLLGYLFDNHQTETWALFFGLIVASVYFVGNTVGRWSAGPIVTFLVGMGIALSIAFLKPASNNTNTLYLVLCGMIGICSMIIPGLSGSFILILLGNYRLVLDSLSEAVSAATSFDLAALGKPLMVIIPIGVGCVVGLLAFSHLISWVFRKFRDAAIALMTGFVAGSLMIIWPWKNNVYMKDAAGNFILKRGEEKIVQGYDWFLPKLTDGQTWLGISLIVTGIVTVVIMEQVASDKEHAS
jgi:putative membrane protein